MCGFLAFLACESLFTKPHTVNLRAGIQLLEPRKFKAQRAIGMWCLAEDCDVTAEWNWEVWSGLLGYGEVRDYHLAPPQKFS